MMFEDVSEYVHDVRTMTPTNEQERLIFAHLPFVISFARRYHDRGLSLLDLIQEGNIGLLIAAQKYDPTQGANFLTYASFWVRQRMERALADQGRTIRIPVYIAEQISKYTKTTVLLEQRLERTPHATELMTALSCTQEQLDALQFMVVTATTESLSWQSESEEERFATDDANPEELVTKQINDDIAHRCLATLTERERRLVLLYYIERWSYADIRKKTGHDLQMVKRTIARALMKMRATAHRLSL